MAFIASDWRIAGSTGVTVSIGTPIVQIQVGGSLLNLPLANTRTKETAQITGTGIGMSVGTSIEPPWSDIANVSVSTKEMPSDGIGMIYKKENSNAYQANDFSGFLAVVSAGVTMRAVSGNICMAMWLNVPFEHCINAGWSSCDILQSISNTSLILNSATMPSAVIQATHAIGLFVGIAVSSDLVSTGADVYTYVMSA